MNVHVDSKVNDKILKFLNKMDGTHGEVKSTRGTVHEYLGMTSDFSEKGKAKVDIIDYKTTMVNDFTPSSNKMIQHQTLQQRIFLQMEHIII